MAIRLIDRYPNRADPANSDYPHGKGRNKSDPTADDGTPFDEARFNDQEAFFQGILEAAGITPSGTVDTVPVSDYIDALLTVARGITEVDVGGSSNVTLDTNQSRVAVVRAFGTLTGDITIAAPDAQRYYLVINDTDGDFDLTFATNTGSGIVIRQGNSQWVYSDGTNIRAIKSVADQEFAGDPNGNLAADTLYERAWDTSVSPRKVYIATAADGSIGGTTWAPLVGSASTTAKGIVELATEAETQAGTDNERAVTPAGLSGTLSSAGARDLAFHSIPHGKEGGPSSTLENIFYFSHWRNPVITTVTGTWRENKACNGQMSPIFIGGNWQMYISGVAADDVGRIGLMVSKGTDLTEWTDPVGAAVVAQGAAGEWDEGGVGSPSVFRIYNPGAGSALRMYFSGVPSDGSGGSISYAGSTDGGRTWTKHEDSGTNSPVFTPGGTGEWDEGGLRSPSVIWDDDLGLYVMAYAGFAAGDSVPQGKIGIATSPDADTWTRHEGNPVLDHGAAGDGDDYGLLSPTLWKEDGVYYIAYSGKRADVQSGEPFEISSICLAWGTDFDSFVKSDNNPIIDARDFGDFTEIEAPKFIRMGDYWCVLTETFVEDANVQLFLGM